MLGQHLVVKCSTIHNRAIRALNLSFDHLSIWIKYDSQCTEFILELGIIYIYLTLHITCIAFIACISVALLPHLPMRCIQLELNNWLVPLNREAYYTLKFILAMYKTRDSLCVRLAQYTIYSITVHNFILLMNRSPKTCR